MQFDEMNASKWLTYLLVFQKSHADFGLKTSRPPQVSAGSIGRNSAAGGRLQSVPRSALRPVSFGRKEPGRLRICRTCPRGGANIALWGKPLCFATPPPHEYFTRR